MSKKNGAKAKRLMLHGIGFVTGDPSIRISYPFVLHPGVRISVTDAGSSKWIYLPIPLCRGDVITEVSISYRNSDMMSHVSMVRLVSQSEPVSATVLHEAIIDRDASGVISHFVSYCHVAIESSTILKLCMEFSSSDDTIEIGAVEITYLPERMAVDAGGQTRENVSVREQLVKLGNSISSQFPINNNHGNKQ